MDQLSDLLKEFDEKQFAFFYQFRYPEFTASSKQIIDDERRARFLDAEKIEEVITTPFILINGHCPRCNSNKFQEESEIIVTDAHGKDFPERISMMCIVCGYNADRAKPISLGVKIRKLLGKYRRTKR